MKQGILLIGDSDAAVAGKAKSQRLGYQAGDDYEIPFSKTLIVKSGVRVPWDLLPAAWSFLDRWDAAVPLWKYGVIAADVGTEAERELTQGIVRDLRVLLFFHEMLFIRQNLAGVEFLDTWETERARGSDDRLSFLRAYYLNKPLLCVLPISWSADVRAMDASRMRAKHPRIGKMGKRKMSRVEIAPGRSVKCNPGDEARVLAYYQEQGSRRR